MDERTRRMLVLPVLALVWNQLAYYTGSFLGKDGPFLRMRLPLDRLVPFLPWTVSVYFGCFLFWALLYICMARQDRAAAYRFFCADFLSKAVCLLFFIFLPTALTRPEVTGSSLWDSLMRLLYRVDAPRNLFPSIHCLVSWLCFVGARNHRRFPRWAVWATALMAALVCLSTLTTRQHVAADVAGGVALAELSYWAAGRPRLLRPFSRTAYRLTAARA